MMLCSKCKFTGKFLKYVLSSSTPYSTLSTKKATAAAAAASAPQRDVNALCGQPTAFTHPHLIKEGELVPGVRLEEFQSRRQRLMSGIQKFARDNAHNAEQNANKSHLVVIPSANKRFMSDKIPYVFRQNSDFYYLSGCLEPDSVLLMSIDENSSVRSTLFMRPKDKHAELWDGPRTGVDYALDLFGVDEAYARDQFPLEMARRMKGTSLPLVWYDSNASDLHDISENVRQSTGNVAMLNSPTKFVQSMRLFKSPAEQELMRRTCQIASAAINDVIKESRPGQSEHHIYAMVDYKCRMLDASFLAYPPVVASGTNATTIHYINNSQLIKNGDLVLMDAGCEYGGYSSDITRTWPIGGSFTEAQKVIYDVVLLLQKELLDVLLQEGGETLDNLFDVMCIKLGKYLQEAGLVSKTISKDSEYARTGYQFCPHHVSHYLGMDVHDTPLMPRNLKLLPGMVFTVEPGIYIAKDRVDVPPEFRGLGVRVEDDVLITADGKIQVLTAECIKERIMLQRD